MDLLSSQFSSVPNVNNTWVKGEPTCNLFFAVGLRFSLAFQLLHKLGHLCYLVLTQPSQQQERGSMVRVWRDFPQENNRSPSFCGNNSINKFQAHFMVLHEC